MPNVSIIIPTHNRARMVGAAVESALSQEVAGLQVIVVDDGSTDGTAQVLGPQRERGVQYLYQEHAGVSAARNRGAQAARHAYVLFLDSDDVLLPGSARALLGAADQSPPAGVLGGGYLYVDERLGSRGPGEPWLRCERLDLARLVVDCALIPSATLVRLDWFCRVGGFDPHLESSVDWDLWLRLADAGCPMTWFKGLVCKYRLHADAMTRATEQKKLSSLTALDKVFERPGLPAVVVQRRSQAYGLVHLHAAAQYYAAGQAEAARPEIEEARRYLPAWRDAELLLTALLRLARSSHPARDPRDFEAAIFASHARRPGARRRVAARLEADEVFESYERHDWRRVRRSWWRAVTHDPTWLGNRGFVSIGVQAILGRRVRRRVRTVRL